MQGAVTFRRRHRRLAATVGAVALVLGLGEASVSAKPGTGPGAPAAARPAAPGITVTATQKPGQSLQAMLIDGGVSPDQAVSATAQLGEAFDVVNLPPGLAVTLKRSSAGELMDLTLEPPTGGPIRAARTPAGGFAIVSRPALSQAGRSDPLAEPRAQVLAGPMQTVLFGGAAPRAAAQQALSLLASRIDLSRDASLDSPVRLEVDRAADRLLSVSITASGRQISFHREGSRYLVVDSGPAAPAATAAAYRISPLPQGRLTSAFGLRLHPLLGFFRPHKGVDLAAPSGTPVVAVADGVVTAARWRGGYGRWVGLSHPGGMDTGYGHLSGWANGLQAGARVRQGQVIGFVGQSGLATGPHLHFEVVDHGVQVDPALAVALGGPSVASGLLASRAPRHEGGRS